MIIYGVAVLSACYLAGQLLGEALGKIIGVESNVGGVGFAMLLLILANDWMIKKGYLHADTEKGIQFWSQMYIPVIVAMSATQNVNAAVSAGLVAILAGILPTALAFAAIPVLSRLFKTPVENQPE